jgi:hypothetical protein
MDFFTPTSKKYPNSLTFSVEMHCHKMHDGMLHEHLSQSEHQQSATNQSINQTISQSVSQSANQPINAVNHQ